MDAFDGFPPGTVTAGKPKERPDGVTEDDDYFEIDAEQLAKMRSKDEVTVEAFLRLAASEVLQIAYDFEIDWDDKLRVQTPLIRPLTAGDESAPQFGVTPFAGSWHEYEARQLAASRKGFRPAMEAKFRELAVTAGIDVSAMGVHVEWPDAEPVATPTVVGTREGHAT